MSDNMELVSKKITDNYKTENALFDDILKNEIFSLIEKYGYTYEKIRELFESELYSTNLKHDLNMIFKKLNKVHGIDLFDIFRFLEEFTKIKKILLFFDEELIWILKQEISKKCGIKINKTELYKILA
jgi:hypothetical protein